jgi:hypothetical protein
LMNMCHSAFQCVEQQRVAHVLIILSSYLTGDWVSCWIRYYISS